MAAALDGHTAAVQALLDKGADVSAKDKDGKTALKFAESKSHTDIVQLLKKSEQRNNQTDSPMLCFSSFAYSYRDRDRGFLTVSGKNFSQPTTFYKISIKI